ncbi:unnamed protein product [Cyclocybe aegerita]|uniref:Arrestin-like N-terminal domain-containing protein n=1 Tax=Cyclocybe aegerita TaxID=1973307 RepID=A0A8S0VTL8_CYCAE|nr:unnamed protein product [Cyclocybe aegerita]
MGREKEKPVLDIVLDSQTLVLKGTAHDFEPTRLSGQVSLLLAEPTTLKELNLQFKGKVRLPPSASDSLITPPPTSVVLSHDWSFLEGDKKHSRTLKAGRHLFPFSLDISGALPSSIFTTALGGSSISYRLRAIAVRPGLAYNLQHIVPIYIVRSFTPEALEYQQTLEIENTWPDKLMYAVTLPHKAWAAGDTIVAILKFSPLVKGVAIQSIVSNLCETTKVHSRGGTREDTKVVATVKHEIVGGRAVEMDTQDIATASSSPQSIDASDIVTYIKLPLPSRCNFQPVTPVLSPVSPAFPTTSSPSDTSPSTSAPHQVYNPIPFRRTHYRHPPHSLVNTHPQFRRTYLRAAMLAPGAHPRRAHTRGRAFV